MRLSLTVLDEFDVIHKLSRRFSVPVYILNSICIGKKKEMCVSLAESGFPSRHTLVILLVSRSSRL